jgi:hypothetical protein
VHVKLSEEEAAAAYMKGGMPEGLSKFLAHIEVKTMNGMEEGLNDIVERLTGRPGLTFDAWATQNKACWN